MSWYTKKDVLNDLAHAMGGRVKDLEEQYILVGEQPPPPCRSGEEDDDEFLLRLNGALGDKTANENENGPDLAGIQEMLRMVDKYQRSDSDENNKTSFQDNTCTTIAISKLNPDVPEFVPKNSISTESIKVETHANEIDELNCNYNNKIKKLEVSGSKENITEKNDPVKLKEISQKLKNKISSPSKSDCLKIKRERNLAISTLLKIHSSASVLDDKSPKLITPAYFEKPCPTEPLNDKAFQNGQKKSTSSTSSFSKGSIENVVLDTKNSNINHEVEESVAKVYNWLNKDEKPSPPGSALYLGPVTFKKKEKVKPKTPANTSYKTAANQTVAATFVPSEYANKLTQSYMERVKAKEEKSMDIWTKLEKRLKAKDEEIIKRRRQEQEPAESSSRTNGEITDSDATNRLSS
ncbi:unnamed protein product [Parnassius apollo]|uniref:(apollo) hypothetical protein n=1 Tax=Parnassius apollo TaxID=110799 RepID=A0A8S3WAP2_PARAO|nr:unnamed protein product [Parnassius apollo]